jgi:hypothetical protein
MTKEELHSFAAAGVAQKLATMERELAGYHKEWPELFLSPTPPQLLKAPAKNGTNGHWPPLTSAEKMSAAKKASWTPERRALQARLMKKRSKAMHAARRAKEAAAKGEQPKRTMSAEGRRKLSLSMKRRHASGEIARAVKRAKRERAANGAH